MIPSNGSFMHIYTQRNALVRFVNSFCSAVSNDTRVKQNFTHSSLLRRCCLPLYIDRNNVRSTSTLRISCICKNSGALCVGDRIGVGEESDIEAGSETEFFVVLFGICVGFVVGMRVWVG